MLRAEVKAAAYKVLTEKHARASAYPDKKDLPLALVDFQVKQAKATDPFEFEGYGSVWNRVDSYGDTMLQGAFVESLKNRMPMMFFGHNPGRVPGKWLKAKEDSNGLKMRGQLTPGHSEAKDLEASLRHQSLSGMSIGGYTEKADWIEEDGKITGRRIKTFNLYEVSVVSMPAENMARVDTASVKSMLDECQTLRDMEDLLREGAGWSSQAAVAFTSRMRRICRGEPGEGGGNTSELLKQFQELTIPQSLGV